MVSLTQFALVFLKVGGLGFGGPYAFLAQMQSEVVDRRRMASAAGGSRALWSAKSRRGSHPSYFLPEVDHQGHQHRRGRTDGRGCAASFGVARYAKVDPILVIIGSGLAGLLL